MTTTTTRYGLTKINPASDNVDVVVDFNNNADAIDLKLGSQVCTSSTRPASPVQGMLAFETDTTFTRVYKGAAWQSTGNAVGSSGSRPASPIQGDMLYETDNKIVRSYGTAWNGMLPTCTVSTLPANPIQGDAVYLSDKECLARYTGTAWHTTGPVICTSTTRPTSSGITLYAGMHIFETDTNRFLIYTGAAWEEVISNQFVCTSTTHPANPYQGLQIFETDTGLSAVYNGSAYNYVVGQIAQTQVLATSAASVTFSGIPSSIRFLTVKWRARSTAAANADNIAIRINGVSTNSYVYEKYYGSNATVAASVSTSTYGEAGAMSAASATANYFGQGDICINGWDDSANFPSYTSSSHGVSNTTTGLAMSYGGLLAVAAVNTSLTIVPVVGSFAAGARFAVQGWM